MAQSVSDFGAKPTKAVTAWLTDQIAPSYWRPNSQIIVSCRNCGFVFPVRIIADVWTSHTSTGGPFSLTTKTHLRLSSPLYCCTLRQTSCCLIMTRACISLRVEFSRPGWVLKCRTLQRSQLLLEPCIGIGCNGQEF